MKRPEKYQLTITTLTPLHIGTGSILRNKFDYTTKRGRTWVINEDELASLLYDGNQQDFDDMVAGYPAADFLREEDFKEDNPLFRYILRGKPRAQSRGAELQELIKDPWDRPYIPGSSLKGALRTALFYVGFTQRNMTFSMKQLNPRGGARFAAQKLEDQLLAGDYQRDVKYAPNRDLGRILRVHDSAPDDTQNMEVVNVSILTGKEPKAPIELEAIRRKTEFTALLTLDTHLLSKEIREQLKIRKDQRTWLKNLPLVVNYWTQQRVAAESKRSSVSGQWAGFVRWLAEQYEAEKLADNEFILQLGWGGGWDSKTLGDHLTADESEFMELVQKYDRQMDKQGKFELGDFYPKSRRVVMNDQNNPLYTLGWVKVRMERME